MFTCFSENRSSDVSTPTEATPQVIGRASPRKLDTHTHLSPNQLNTMPLDDVIGYARTHPDFFTVPLSLWTKMLVAIELNNRTEVKSLIERDKKGNKLSGTVGPVRGSTSTLLHLAAYIGNEQIIELLLDSPAVTFLNYTDDTDETPLFIAATRGFTEVMGRLLVAGANPHKGNAFNESPLYAAAYQGHLAAVRMLLKFGCDPVKKSGEGMTPEAAALSRSHDLVAEILRRTTLWPRLRLLFIGHIKSDRDCIFASLRLQTIKRIASLVVGELM